MLTVTLLESVVGTLKLWLNGPAAVGANWMVNVHEVPGGKLLDEHISSTMENGAGSTGSIRILMPRFPAPVNVIPWIPGVPTGLSPKGTSTCTSAAGATGAALSTVAVIVTDALALFAFPSFTTSEATYAPAMSAVKLGVAEVASVSVAVLPAGLEVSVQV